MKLLFFTPFIVFITLNNNVVAQTNLCNTNPAGELTVNSSCVTSTMNTNTNNDYWDNAPNDGSCSGAATDHDDKWAWFTATAVTTTITYQSADDPVLHLFDGGCNANTMISIACSDELGPGETETITYATTIGNVYHVRIQLWNSNDQMNGDICIHSPGPPIAANNDCNIATPICGSSTIFSGNSSGPGVSGIDPSIGLTAEFGEINNGFGNSGCLFGENQSSWYTFTVNTSGSLGFVISPQHVDDDYDFALWGPNPTCTPNTSPVRCSFSDENHSHQTGLVNGSGDNSEDDTGNGFVNDINVIAGETYLLLVDNFQASNSPFDLTWSGTATLDCSILPIKLDDFNGHKKNDVNLLTWTTLSEMNNDYFTLEVSTDGINFRDIQFGNINGAGNSSHKIEYQFEHTDFRNTINYYRLTQTDFDGASVSKGVISINNTIESITLIKTINILGQTVHSNQKGFIIELYSNGTTKKIFRK